MTCHHCGRDSRAIRPATDECRVCAVRSFVVSNPGHSSRSLIMRMRAERGTFSVAEFCEAVHPLAYDNQIRFKAMPSGWVWVAA